MLTCGYGFRRTGRTLSIDLRIRRSGVNGGPCSLTLERQTPWPLWRGGEDRSGAFGRWRNRWMRATAKGRQIGSKRMIMPDTCPDRGSRWSFRRSGCCSGRSVKPSTQPALVRTRHLPLLLARGSRRDQDHPVRSNAKAKSPAGAAQPTHRCPSRRAGSIPQRERSTQEPDRC